MKKIISLFKRDYEGDRLVFDEVVEGAEWVFAGEGVATRKWDGTCCRILEGYLFKRYEVKKGKIAPATFISETDVDPVTGKRQGWSPVGTGPEDKWHVEGLETLWTAHEGRPPDCTYELLGPKVQGNPEMMHKHCLVKHGGQAVSAPRTFEGLKAWFRCGPGRFIEGVVWHHDDGRMVKIKGKDFGFKRQERETRDPELDTLRFLG